MTLALIMARMKRWLRTDKYADVESSLRMALQAVRGVDRDILEWKWVLVAVHAAVQGFFVLSLSKGNSLLTLKGPHARAWLKAYRSGGPWPQKLDLDYFLELYAKAKQEISSGLLADPTNYDEGMRTLNNLRNGFIHFSVDGWSVELAGLPMICMRCLEVTDHLAWRSSAIRWRSEAQSTRMRRLLRAITRQLRHLDTLYKR
jgi:hypothetical protein